MPPYKYTICFLKKGGDVLLINRRKAPWMGAWNGVGGKLEPGEAPLAGILREVMEETGLRLESAEDKGVVTWIVDGKHAGGMHVFTAELMERDDPFQYPQATDEGILDWKPVEWVCHPDNKGVAGNLPAVLPYVLRDPERYEHRCTFTNDCLVGVEALPLLAARS